MVGGRQPRPAGCEVSARHGAVAKPRVIIHSNCLSTAVAGRLETAFSLQTLAAPKTCATTLTWDYA
jgi:hypothetical protein